MTMVQENNKNEQEELKPLENIFRKKNRSLFEKLKEVNEDHKLHHNEELKLQTVSGIKNSSVLANAIDLGITAETITAINLIPLIKVACADNKKCDSKERNIILKLASRSGIQKDSSSYELIEHWLETEFNPNLTLTWKNYLKSLKEKMSHSEYLELKKEVLKKCRKVAKVSGSSVMGLGPLSKKETQALKDIEKAFH